MPKSTSKGSTVMERLELDSNKSGSKQVNSSSILDRYTSKAGKSGKK